MSKKTQIKQTTLEDYKEISDLPVVTKKLLVKFSSGVLMLAKEEEKNLDSAVRTGLKKIGIEPLFFQNLTLDYPLTESNVTGDYSVKMGRWEYPHPGIRKDQIHDTPSRGYARLGVSVIHDNTRRYWERRPVNVFTNWDGNSLPESAISILQRLQITGLPIGASIMVWTPERFSHIGGEVPDPILVLEIGKSCFALCRWNG